MSTVPLPYSEAGPIWLRTRPIFEMTDDAFFELCQINRQLRIERTAEGDLAIMPPAGGETGDKNAYVIAFLKIWSLQDTTGVAFDSSTGFILPNRAIRSPDAAWVKRERLAHLTPEQKKKFLPLTPDFVIELCSPSDTLRAVQEKMAEYMANGVRLGLLLDPQERCVYVYRPAVAVVRLESPSSVSAEPELPGFVLDLTHI